MGACLGRHVGTSVGSFDSEAGEAVPCDLLESVKHCFVVGGGSAARSRFDLRDVHAYEGFQI